MMKNVATSFILHARSYKESSLLLNLFSKEFGRFTLIAKGVKRKKSQAMRAILQPFNLLRIEYTGRGELKTLCSAELIFGQFKILHRALACGYYINELVMRSTQEWQEFPELFVSYKQSLFELQLITDFSGLESTQEITRNTSKGEINETYDVDESQFIKSISQSPSSKKNNIVKSASQKIKFSEVLRKFEVSLLSELGVSPSWTVDVKGQSICADANYRFVNEQGFEIISNGEDEGYSGQTILNLGDSTFSTEMTKSSQHITQMLLRQIIGNQPLESRKLWIK